MASGYLALPYLFARTRTRTMSGENMHLPIGLRLQGTPPPSFSLKKISAELIAIFIAFLLRCSQFRDQRDGTTGVPDVSNVSDTLVFPLLAHEEKERP